MKIYMSKALCLIEIILCKNPLYPCSLKLSQTSSMLHLYSQPEIQLLEASAEKRFTGMSSKKILEKIEEYKTSIWWKSSEMLILSTVRITVSESCEWYPTKSLIFAINLKHPHILSIHILHTVLFTIFYGTEKENLSDHQECHFYLNRWSFHFFSRLFHLIQGWYCVEKLEASYSFTYCIS